ncbi:MAG TPA: DMT family transporter [Rhizomicrobium sp.]|nr:DMT family transporter [Rhizomicrobium sp.]
MGASIFLGLLAALFYGTANFTVRPACQGAGVFRTMAYGQWLAAPFLTIAILMLGLPHAPFGVWGVLVLSDLLLLAGTGLVCVALSQGRIKVAAPIAASYGGVSALLSVAAGTTLGLPRWAAIALITSGCVLAAMPGGKAREAKSESGALPATGAALLFGLAYWLQGRWVIPKLGTLAPVWSYYLLGSLLMPLIARIYGISLKKPAAPALGWIAATTVLATAAYLVLTAGLATSFPVIVPVLSAFSSAITVLLGQVILKERGTVQSWTGLAAITLGLIVLRAV